MKRARAALWLVVLGIVTCSPVLAGERLGITIKAGSLGAGVDLTGRFNDWISLRASANAIDVSRTYDKSDVSYDGDVKLGAFGLLLDVHPFRGNFRLTAGLMKNRNGIDLKARPTDDVEIGNTTYTPAQAGTLRGNVDFNDTAPYFGIGYGSAAKGPKRVRFAFDLGVLQQGSGDVSISSSSRLVSSDDLRQEEADLEDDIDNYKLWPVIALGISFRL